MSPFSGPHDEVTALQLSGTHMLGVGRFMNMMNDPARPLGRPHLENMAYRAFGTVIFRHETRPVRTQVVAGILAPLQAWVRDLHAVFDPANQNPPKKMSILTFGLPGRAFDIRAWDDRNSGFMGWAVQRNQ